MGARVVTCVTGEVMQYLGMRFETFVVHETVGQSGEKKVEKKATERDDEPQAKKLAAPVVGRGGRHTRQSENALVRSVQKEHAKSVSEQRAQRSGAVAVQNAAYSSHPERTTSIGSCFCFRFCATHTRK